MVVYFEFAWFSIHGARFQHIQRLCHSSGDSALLKKIKFKNIFKKISESILNTYGGQWSCKVRQEVVLEIAGLQ